MNKFIKMIASILWEVNKKILVGFFFFFQERRHEHTHMLEERNYGQKKMADMG